MSNCCDSSYYKTPFNVRYQNLYCNLAQQADTDVKTMVTSGWSYIPSNRVNGNVVKEGYCNCVSKLVNTPMVLRYKEDSRFC